MTLPTFDTWIFDLDNTLYPAGARLFDQVSERIEAYVSQFLGLDAASARVRQRDYFYKHGTTLRGLMVEHGADPTHYLDFVHDIDLSILAADAQLRRQLEALPGRRLIFTNADTAYAKRVLDQLRIGDLFEAIHDVHASSYIPKPRPEAYAAMVTDHQLVPHRCVFFEDMARNLAPAKALGMTTVWIDNSSDQGPPGDDGLAHVDYRSTCVASGLAQLVRPV